MAGITLDAGALIAADREDLFVVAYLREAIARGRPLITPAPVVAQAWRSPRNARMKQLLDKCFIEPMSAEMSFAVGALLARSRTADVVDAVLVLSASRRGDTILTGDPSDIRRLLGFVSGGATVTSLQSLHRP